MERPSAEKNGSYMVSSMIAYRPFRLMPETDRVHLHGDRRFKLCSGGYRNKNGKLAGMEIETAFSKGFRLGAPFMIDVFGGKE